MKPNMYKAKMAIMGMNACDVIKHIKNMGIIASRTEFSTAINGGTQPKHIRIREAVEEVYTRWERGEYAPVDIRQKIKYGKNPDRRNSVS